MERHQQEQFIIRRIGGTPIKGQGRVQQSDVKTMEDKILPG